MLAIWQLAKMPKEKKTSSHPLWVWRTSRNIKQNALAEAIGVHKSTLNKIEWKGARPSLKVAVAIETATKGKIKAKELLRPEHVDENSEVAA
jgi:DNA-binding XRE family transcriptional regulator